MAAITVIATCKVRLVIDDKDFLVEHPVIFLEDVYEMFEIGGLFLGHNHCLCPVDTRLDESLAVIHDVFDQDGWVSVKVIALFEEAVIVLHGLVHKRFRAFGEHDGYVYAAVEGQTDYSLECVCLAALYFAQKQTGVSCIGCLAHQLGYGLLNAGRFLFRYAELVFCYKFIIYGRL